MNIFEQHFKTTRPDDPWLFAHQARYIALRKMRQDGLEELGYKLVDIAHSGIFIQSDDYEIRVLKATYRIDREAGTLIRSVPNPGTMARREYFEQPALFEIPREYLLLDIARRLKLVVLWDHDTTHQLNYLDLACPKRWTQSSNCVELHWLQPIPELHIDVESTQVSPTPTVSLDDIDVRERDAELETADANSDR